MLSTVASTGLAADPALPCRDELLDADAVAPMLAASLGRDGPLDVQGCGLVRAKYRIGESLRVVYRLDLGGQQQLVTARAFRGGASRRAYQAAIGSAVAADPLQPVHHDAERGIVWWAFPNDRKLRGLDELIAPSSRMLFELQAGDAGRGRVGGWAASDVVEYAPERSVTLRATDAAGTTIAFAKAYAPGTTDVSALAERYARIATALDASDVAAVSPRPLGHSTSRNLLLLQPMRGAHWGGEGAAGSTESMRALGSAIGALHAASPAVPGLSHFGRLDIGRISHSAELIALARPDVGAQALTLVARLAGEPPRSAPDVVLHGDCHPKNALLDGPRVALIDLDQSGYGPAAADIGSLLARLRHGTVLGEHPATVEHQLAEAFLGGYAEIRDLPDRVSLGWHTSAALLAERGMRAVNRVHLPALGRLDQLLAAAHEVLDPDGSRWDDGGATHHDR